MLCKLFRVSYTVSGIPDPTHFDKKTRFDGNSYHLKQGRTKSLLSPLQISTSHIKKWEMRTRKKLVFPGPAMVPVLEQC